MLPDLTDAQNEALGLNHPTVLSLDLLLAQIREYNPRANFDLIAKAYRYAAEMHKDQTRHSGEPYIMHPIAVASILAAQHLDDATIITSLLHDVIEDTKTTYLEMEEMFGTDVAKLVDGVTKLTNLELSSTENKQAENFRKLLLAMSKDLRVLLVKLGDRLHNMRTIRHMRPDKQQKKARETMDIFAPLAGRMGMQWMREELEDLSFSVINPDARISIMKRFLNLRGQSDDLIPQITNDIKAALEAGGVTAGVFGREKRPYSIWRKMQEKNEGFSRLSDIYGFRIITKTEDESYKVLGLIHRRWKAVPGRFKDYISQPKLNGYRSIHTTVSGRDGKRVEMQIRTEEMHEVAESGVAAHWAYKDGMRSQNRFSVDPTKWLNDLTEGFDSADQMDEFLEHVKLDMFADQVFCFTPKGEVIPLPRGATPIDFAYAIHTRIGSACVGAKVDGRRIPLWTRLRNGQSVEITTAAGQRPQSTWIDIAVTGRAKTAIRRALREEHREGFMRLGRELARVSLEHVGKKATDKALGTAAKTLGLNGIDDLLARLGSAELTGTQVVGALYPELTRDEKGEVNQPGGKIVGLKSEQYSNTAHCCQPLPGERIVGIATRGKGVIVHRIDCDRLIEYEDQPDRWLDLHWTEGRSGAQNPATLEITMANDAGVLGRLCTLVGEHNANIRDLVFTERKPDFYRVVIEIEVRDKEHLHHVMTAIEADSDVAQVVRKSGADL